MIDIVMHRKRHIGIQAVDRAAGSIHQMRYVCVPAAFQNIDEPHQIAVHVGMRIFNAVAHAGLRRQIDDHVKTGIVKKTLHFFPVGEIQLNK